MIIPAESEWKYFPKICFGTHAAISLFFKFISVSLNLKKDFLWFNIFDLPTTLTVFV